MKYVCPPAEIELYVDGFDKLDLLDRKKTGEKLSQLVEKIQDPFVIAVDGQWGSGKSFFLRCWVGAHSLENGGSAKTVYIDAFEHDFMEEPLVALTATISKRLEGDPEASKIWKSAKFAAAKLWRPAARIGLATATAGLTEVVNIVADAAVESTSAEISKQVDNFWKKEEGKIAAMRQFREALKKLTSDAEHDDARPLVVVIDELDRCRPDFALSMLETIKHFFSVPNVHFVLGVNLAELENSVRTRYGNSVDARNYLQKFIDISMTLPVAVEVNGYDSAMSHRFFSIKAVEMGLDAKMIEDVLFQLKHVPNFKTVTLRTIQKILTEMALFPLPDGGFERFSWGYKFLMSGLIIQKHVSKDFYVKALNGTLTMEDVDKDFGVALLTGEDDTRIREVINHVWSSCLQPGSTDEDRDWGNIWGHTGRRLSAKTIQNICQEYLEAFRLA